MNIALVYNIKNQNQGGGYTFQEELLKNIEKLKDNKTSFTLICSQKTNNNFLEKYEKNFKNILNLNRNIYDRFRENLIRNFNFISERSIYVSKLDKLCLDNKIDIILFLDNIHTIHTSIPFVTIVYDVDHLKFPFFPEYSKNNKWYKRENSLSNHLRKASGIISGTNYGISQIKEYYGIPSNKLFKIPHPSINYNFEKDILIDNKYIKKCGLEKNKFLFYPAQFWAHKNHKSLIDLGIELKKEFQSEIKIVLSGSDKGNLSYIKNEIKKNNLNDIFKYLGFINKNELFTLYKNCLALTYVSYGGPENLPPLEAFSSGCPVIAAKNEGSIEQLEDGAILIDPNNTNEFMQSIKKLNDVEYKTDLIKKGLAISNKKSIDNFMIDLKKILLSLQSYINTWKNIN